MYPVDAGVARRVENAVGRQPQDLLNALGGSDANRVAADQRADVDAVFGIGIHSRANDLQVGPVVDDCC